MKQIEKKRKSKGHSVCFSENPITKFIQRIRCRLQPLLQQKLSASSLCYEPVHLGLIYPKKRNISKKRNKLFLQRFGKSISQASRDRPNTASKTEYFNWENLREASCFEMLIWFRSKPYVIVSFKIKINVLSLISTFIIQRYFCCYNKGS